MGNTDTEIKLRRLQHEDEQKHKNVCKKNLTYTKFIFYMILVITLTYACTAYKSYYYGLFGTQTKPVAELQSEIDRLKIENQKLFHQLVFRDMPVESQRALTTMFEATKQDNESWINYSKSEWEKSDDNPENLKSIHKVHR